MFCDHFENKRNEIETKSLFYYWRNVQLTYIPIVRRITVLTDGHICNKLYRDHIRCIIQAIVNVFWTCALNNFKQRLLGKCKLKLPLQIVTQRSRENSLPA